MKATIKDIARLANVSTATVSKILNKKDKHISEKTREKIHLIAKELNYTPNTLARSLVTRRTKTIGLILPDITNPFFPELARGAEDMASLTGYSIIYCNTDDDAKKEEKYIDVLLKKMADGIIMAHSGERNRSTNKLKMVGTPIILIDRDSDEQGVRGKVLVDNLTGAYEAVKHLLLKGYRKIVYVTGPMTDDTVKTRLEGYKMALNEFNVAFKDEYVLEGQYKSDWGFAAVLELLDRKIDMDAIFCGNDVIAISVIKALKDNGKAVPKDVAVVGFDDISMASLIEPPLTTVSQPTYEMGYKAVEMLVDILKNPSDQAQRSILLNTKLIIRKTT